MDSQEPSRSPTRSTAFVPPVLSAERSSVSVPGLPHLFQPGDHEVPARPMRHSVNATFPRDRLEGGRQERHATSDLERLNCACVDQLVQDDGVDLDEMLGIRAAVGEGRCRLVVVVSEVHFVGSLEGPHDEIDIRIPRLEVGLDPLEEGLRCRYMWIQGHLQLKGVLLNVPESPTGARHEHSQPEQPEILAAIHGFLPPCAAPARVVAKLWNPGSGVWSATAVPMVPHRLR